MNKTFTSLAIERLRPPPTGRLELGDTTVPGLCIRVTEKGVKSWSLIYRVDGAGGLSSKGHILKGKQQRLTLGVWPIVDLVKAREKARDALRLASEGRDPIVLRQQELLQRVTNSMESVVKRFIELHAKPSTRNWHATQRMMELHVFPEWRNRPISGIRRSDVHELLDNLIKDKRVGIAREIRKHLSRIFNFAADREIISANPLAGMARRDLRPVQEAGRALADWELRAIWKAAEQMEYPFGSMYKVLMLTGQRLREIADASRPEISERQKCLDIPRERYKGKRDHVVPLAPQVWDILEKLPRWNRGDFLFTTTAGECPISGFSKAKARLDTLAQKIVQESTPEGVEVKTLAAYRVHDFRVTCESGMAALGVGREARDAVLGHAKPGLQKTYNKHDYLDEKRTALERWAQHVMGVVSE